MTDFPARTLADWEKLARKELRDRPLETLTVTTPEGIAEIPLIKDPPSSIYVLDLRGPDFLVNRDYAAWFGLKEVRIRGTAGTDRTRPN